MITTISSLQPPATIEQRGNGNVVLLLHGWGGSKALFTPTINTLATHQPHMRFIVPDFPGFGDTPPPPTAWGVREYAAWVVALLDALSLHEERVHIVAHSFGGRVAIVLANTIPHRINKIVLTGSAGIRPKRTLRYHLSVGRYKLGKWLIHTPGTRHIAPLQQWAQQQTTRAGSSDYQQASGTVRQSFVRVVNDDLRHLLPTIVAPTLLIWGEADEDTPLADGTTMERLIPDAGLVVLHGAGHYAYLEQSARFCTIVATFLTDATTSTKENNTEKEPSLL